MNSDTIWDSLKRISTNGDWNKGTGDPIISYRLRGKGIAQVSATGMA
jgi:hypothetical protein